MVKLRHVHVHNAYFSVGDGGELLGNLVTLSSPCFSCAKDVELISRKAPNLQELRCSFVDFRPKSLPKLDFLTRLETLEIHLASDSMVGGPYNFPSSLRNLTLSNFFLGSCHESNISKLPNLLLLKLVSIFFDNDEWEVSNDEYLELKVLKLVKCEFFEDWKVSDDAFPRLEHLVLRECPYLKGIPICFGECDSLKAIKVKSCNESVERSAMDITERQGGSLSVVSASSSLCSDDFVGFEGAYDIDSSQNFVDAEKGLRPKGGDLIEMNVEDTVSKPLAVAVKHEEQITTDSSSKSDEVSIQLPVNKGLRDVVSRSSFEVDCVPFWGYTSVCGRRLEMEDALSTVPGFCRIPLQMLIGNHVPGGSTRSLSHLTAHFFGVYDGHGGPEVANYCRDRIHVVLAEELETIMGNLNDEFIRENCQEIWNKVFTNCFLKVDCEVGGIGNREPVAPEYVGSTAIVVVVCSSHIIVANCGDSRAVLCRGKESMALSVDHKPDREDECARIKAAGGKIIQWNGHRVFGALAMSRSIGDRYLKPWIIPDPEVMFIPRTRDDELLIIASDGLWAVMTDQEACDLARHCILLWHKTNSSMPPSKRGQGVDLAVQSAAEYLSHQALQKGSEDNITVIVVDLKAQRKFKSKTIIYQQDTSVAPRHSTGEKNIPKHLDVDVDVDLDLDQDHYMAPIPKGSISSAKLLEKQQGIRTTEYIKQK